MVSKASYALIAVIVIIAAAGIFMFAFPQQPAGDGMQQGGGTTPTPPETFDLVFTATALSDATECGEFFCADFTVDYVSKGNLQAGVTVKVKTNAPMDLSNRGQFDVRGNFENGTVFVKAGNLTEITPNIEGEGIE